MDGGRGMGAELLNLVWIIRLVIRQLKRGILVSSPSLQLKLLKSTVVNTIYFQLNTTVHHFQKENKQGNLAVMSVP